MRRLASMIVATSVLLGGTSFAIAQQTTRAVPTYYNPTYYKASYYKPAPTMAEVKQIFEAAGYMNPTDLSLDGQGTWNGMATMENHQVKVTYSRQNGISQLTR